MARERRDWTKPQAPTPQAEATFRLLEAVRGTRTPDGQVYLPLADGTVVSGRLFGVSAAHVWVGSRHRVRRIPSHEIALG